MRIESNTGTQIQSVEDWEKYAPPKRKSQWKDCRSAKELAKAFFRNGKAGFPEELYEILSSICPRDTLTIERAVAEKTTQLDHRKGEQRNHDLYIEARCKDETVTACIEAKVDEPFGKTIRDTVEKGLKRNPRAQIKARVDELSQAIFGCGYSDDASQGSLRYQLLTAISGTMIAATEKSASRAIFIVYEFRTPKSHPHKVEENERALTDFVAYLTRGKVASVIPGKLYGPFHVFGGARIDSHIPLYIGKVVVTACGQQ